MDVFLGIVFGGLIAFLVSWIFYVKSSNQLKEEAQKLRDESEKLGKETKEIRRLSTGVLDGLDEAGLIEVGRDERGDFEGVVVRRQLFMEVNVRKSESEGSGEQNP